MQPRPFAGGGSRSLAHAPQMLAVTRRVSHATPSKITDIVAVQAERRHRVASFKQQPAGHLS